jgi:glutathione S-transferase
VTAVSKSGLPARHPDEEAAMKLYEFGPTRSIRVRWVLQELGVPFESVPVNLRAGEHRRPEFLALNPAGKLPVLVDGDLVLAESVAIVLYLAEKHPERGLLPRDLASRAHVYRWLLFAATELEQPLWRITRHTSLYPEPQRLPAEVPVARRDFEDMAAVAEQHLRGRPFVAGEGVTVADLVLAYTLDWANEYGLLDGFPELRAYLARMYARPSAPPRIGAAMAQLAAAS